MDGRSGGLNAELYRRGAQAYQWRALQARVWEPATRQALQQVGLAAGQSALDVGCGTCDVLPLLAGRVGASGRVTGLDIDGPLAEQALQCLNGRPPLAATPGVCHIVAGDVLAPASLAGAPFDLVFARALVFHAPAPLPLLRRLWTLVRAGGTLLVMDHDVTSMRPVAPHVTFDHATRLAKRAWWAAARDLEIGTHMPRLFEAAGIGPPDGCDVGGAIQPAAPSAALLRSVLGDQRQILIGAALADEAELHRLDGDLAAAAADEARLRWPDLVATWKRK
jgi:SAM-dependent methyltransferase